MGLGAGSVGSVCGDVGLVIDWIGVGEDGRLVASIWVSRGGLEVGRGMTDDVEASQGRC